ncbi:R213A-like protein [Mya arenaria]|uniref:R213A-like protein n=1 Tax=Mya arenaria TaxID=6604 RepID=A0ABY7EMH7_MYAAR|nr:R213A-like protein [Mya arenaria]
MPRKDTYYVELSVPANTVGSYSYRMDMNQWFQSLRPFESQLFKLQPYTVHRDIINKFSAEDSIVFHLEHILIDSVVLFSFMELCMQIEDVFSQGANENNSTILKKVLEKANFFNRDGNALCAFMLNRVKNHFTLQTMLDAQISERIIKSVAERNLKDFPVSCIAGLIQTLKYIYKIAQANQSEIGGFLLIFFDCFGEEYLNTFLEQCKHEKEKHIDFVRFYSDETVIPLCKRFIECTRISGSGKIMCNFISLLPLSMALSLYKQFSNEFIDNDAILKKIRDLLIEKLGKARKDNDLLGICDIAIHFEDIGLSSRLNTIATFEKAITDCFEPGVVSGDAVKIAVLKVLEQTGCFREKTSRFDLLKAVTRSGNPCVNQLLIELGKHANFHSVFSELQYEHIKVWLDNIIKLGRDEKWCHAFEQLANIFRLKLLSEETHERLVGHLTTFMDFETLDKLLRQLWRIEHVLDDHPCLSAAYEKTVMQLMSTKRHTDAIEMLCQNKRLAVESRIRGTLTCRVIEYLFNGLRQEQPEVLFQKACIYVDILEILDNVTGSESKTVSCNETIVCIVKSIKKTVSQIKRKEANMEFLSKLKTSDEKTKKLLIFGGLNNDEIEKIPLLLKELRDSLKESTNDVLTVLNALRRRRDSIPIRGIDQIIEAVNDKKYDIDKEPLKSCIWPHLFWGDLEYLPAECIQLCKVIESTLFWNVGKESIVSEYERTMEQVSNECIYELCLCAIRFLFDDFPDKAIADPVSSYKLIEFIGCTNTIGIKAYKEAWAKLEDCGDQINITDVFKMFTKADVAAEIELANVFRGDIKLSLDKTLRQLWKINDIGKDVSTLQNGLKAFGYDLSKDTKLFTGIESFLNLKCTLDSLNKSGSCSVDNVETLASIETPLGTIFSILEKLTSQALSIMEEISRSTSLIEFLTETGIDDVRNLIDAVEDISESHVNESTVSALIDTKKFIFPLLIGSSDERSCMWFLNEFQAQVNRIKDAERLPPKICDCIENLHNLKSLYNNVANRGQQTREIVNSILTKGDFVFQLNDSEKVVFEVRYNENDAAFVKQESTLSDIRSRALLLLNSDRKSSEGSNNPAEFKAYIDDIDVCLEIKDILQTLYLSGHIYYKKFAKHLQRNELVTERDNIRCDLEKWTETLHITRESFYLMNFIHGCQIHTFFEFLTTENCHADVDFLLHYIHPNMSAKSLLNQYKDSSTDEEFSLQMLGNALHEVYVNGGLELFHRDVEKDGNVKKKMTETVHSGKLLVANLDEKSENVIRTILALYRNTSDRLPEPNQLLICTGETSFHEIDLFINRCKGSLSFYKETPLYCIAYVETLQNKVQFQLVDKLRKIDEFEDCKVAVVCRGSKHHPFVNQLSDFLTYVHPLSDQSMSTVFLQMYPTVVTYTSEVAGLGKTTEISREARRSNCSLLTVHFSGKLNRNELIEKLNSCNAKSYHVLHFDIGTVDNASELDRFLFELVIMKFIATGKIAISLPTERLCFEISNTINNDLRNSLPTATAFKRVHLEWKDFADFHINKEINSSVQVVCHYLKALEDNTLDTKEIKFTGESKVKPLQADCCRSLLQKCLVTATDKSFATVNTFLNVLGDQLKKLSCSTFFKVYHLSLMIGDQEVSTVRSSLVKAMIEVSKEFATRSVDTCRATQTASVVISDREARREEGSENDTNECNDLTSKLVARADSMIRWEESNHLIYVFHNQNIQTLTPMYRDNTKVPDRIKKLFETQMKKRLPDFSSMKQDELQHMLQKIARVNPKTLNVSKLQSISKDYALTPDNLLKMVLIVLRILSKVPVVVMGETGCGKTSLIRYLANICEVSFVVLNVHAGVSVQTVIEYTLAENKKCKNDFKETRWLFFDEINTSYCIGLICDIICHHKCNGHMLAPNLIIMGACNPYKLRTREAIQTAGLTGKVKTDELSKLVYRVFPLPEMMVDYVWDFGSLSNIDEIKYIERMIEDVLLQKNLRLLLRDLLSVSQDFVREYEKSTCVVSLRDVSRCKKLVQWFMSFLKRKHLLVPSRNERPREIRAFVLALGVCYHSRFVEKSARCQYRQRLGVCFAKNMFPDYLENDIHDIIKDEQQDILDRMELPPGTAKNTALQENVFMIVVCILNKIPIFVVGKPGCSKSLAMQIIRSNLRGKDSKDVFFRTLPQLYCVSFQGSESSTSEGIIKVFEKAENYQKSNRRDDVFSVVLFDEIGLAEISRFNPLKVLHSLLEPDGQSQPNVAVVGISNWSLDASKMNRGIHLSRPDMDEEELLETAISISKSFTDATCIRTGLIGVVTRSALTTSVIKHELNIIAKAYTSYTNQLQFKNFHGLRDFYALVKYIARKLSTHTFTISDRQKEIAIIEGLQRNFGGFKTEHKSMLKTFQIGALQSQPVLSIVDLIEQNIVDEMARHLMIITSGEPVIGILDSILKKLDRTGREIIYGSQFQEDQTEDYQYRILSRIILCMEQGIVLILKDLESVYGSLYDMLNQNYTKIGRKNNCRVALGPYSNPFCHVADSFRCIVLVDSNRLDYTDPPFLNRFEKQYLSYSDVLTEKEMHLKTQILEWVDMIGNIKEKTFAKLDIFPFYNEEMIVSLVLWAKQACSDTTVADYIERCKNELMWIMKPDAILRMQNAENIEIQEGSSTMRDEYFNLPLHDGLPYLQEYVETKYPCGLMTVIYTNSKLHTRYGKSLKGDVQTEILGAFKSEKQLSQKIQEFWNSTVKQILLVHCHSVEDERHIMLTKSIIERYRKDCNPSLACSKYVYMILHLTCRPVSSSMRNMSLTTGPLSQINFLSGWKLVMLESLNKPVRSLPELCSKSLLHTLEDMMPFSDQIKQELFWSFTRIKYGRHGRNINSITQIKENILRSTHFLEDIADMIWSSINIEHVGYQNEDWCVDVASDLNALNTSEFFVEALERFILDVIKIPLAKIMYKLEQMMSVDSYFVDDGRQKKRREYWLALFKDENVFSTASIKDETGPECYNCTSPDLRLKLPFSSIIFDNVDETRETFIVQVNRAKINCNLETDEELPPTVMDELFHRQEEIIASRLHKFCENHQQYEGFLADYIDDFCNLLSHTFTSELDESTRVTSTHWILSQKMDFSPGSINEKGLFQLLTELHCTSWLNMSLVSKILHIIDLSVDVIPDCNRNPIGAFIKNNNKTGTSDEDSQKTADSLVFVAKEKTDAENQTILDEKQSEIGMERQFVACDLNSESFELVRHSYDVDESDSQSNEYDKGSFQEEEIEDNIFNVFVSFISKRLLPTDSQLRLFQGIGHWQSVARNILLEAEDICAESVAYQALRLCYDVTSYMIIPYALESKLLHTLSLCLLEYHFDSKDVLDDVMLVISKVYDPNTQNVFEMDSSLDVQRIIRQYLVGCLSIDPETKAYSMLLPLLQQHVIPEQNIFVLKGPFTFILQQELDETGTESLLREDGNEHDEAQHNSFLKCLDSCVTDLFEQNRGSSMFMLMITDLLQENIREHNDTDIMLRSGHILQGGDRNLKLLAAVAYLRATIYCIASDPEIGMPDKRNPLLDALNGVLTGSRTTDVSKNIATYFFKCLGVSRILSTVLNAFHRLKESIEPLKCIEWRDDSILTSIEFNPMALYQSKKLQESVKSRLSDNQTEEKFGKSIKKLVSENSVTNRKLFVFAVSLKEYYLSRFYKQIDDSGKALATICQTAFETILSNERQRTLLKCILGKKDFLSSKLMITEEINCRRFMLCSVLVTTYSKALAMQSSEEEYRVPLLRKCLFTPNDFNACYLPGLPNNSKSARKAYMQLSTTDAAYFSCTCGQILVFHSEMETYLCIVCKKDLGEHQPRTLTDFLRHTEEDIQKGYTLILSKTTLAIEEKQMPIDHTIRRLSPVTCKMTQFLITGCIFGSLALGFKAQNDIDLFKDVDSTIDLYDLLWERIELLWEDLKHMLNLGDRDVGIFFHAVIKDASISNLLFEERESFTTQEGRKNWESTFDRALQNMLNNKLIEINKATCHCDERLKGYEQVIDYSNLELQIREAVPSPPPNDQYFQHLLRLSKHPSNIDFFCQVWTHKDDLCFLTRVLQQVEILNLPRHIINIIQWHYSSVINISYTLKRSECLKMTVLEYQESLKDKRCMDTSKKIFKEFKASWYDLSKIFESSEVFPNIKPINNGSKMSECLILDSDGEIYSVLRLLINIQNHFIVNALSLSEKCPSLQFLLRDKSVSCYRSVQTSELRKSHLLELKDDWDDVIKSESHCDLSYGYGRQVKYDFHKIERRLAEDILFGKAFLNLNDLPEIVFIDELYRDFLDLINDVSKSVLQEPLPKDLEEFYRERCNDDKTLAAELLNSLDMIMIFLKKTKCDEKKSLASFVNERKTIIGSALQSRYLPSSNDKLQVCHVISLHECLEDIRAARIIETLDYNYHEELETDIEDQIRNAINHQKADIVLKAIRRFIYRCVYMGDIGTDQTLFQYLQQASFWPANIFKNKMLCFDGGEEEIKKVVPMDIQVKHVVALVQILTEKAKKPGHQRLTNVIMQAKSKDLQAADKKKKKAQTRKLRKIFDF